MSGALKMRGERDVVEDPMVDGCGGGRKIKGGITCKYINVRNAVDIFPFGDDVVIVMMPTTTLSALGQGKK